MWFTVYKAPYGPNELFRYRKVRNMVEKNLKDLYADTLKKMNDLTPRQRQILEASLALFSKQGFEATTSSQIAKKAGVAVGSVYQRFPNKRALLMAVLTPLFEIIFPKAANEFIASTLGQEYLTLDAFIHALINDRMPFINDNKEEIKIMLGQLLTDPAFAKQITKVFNDQLITTVSPTIRQLKMQELIIDLPDDVIIQFILSPLVAFFGKLLLNIPFRSINDEINYTCTLLINALSPRTDTGGSL